MKYILLITLSITSLFANKFYYEFGKKIEVQETTSSKSLKSSDAIQQYTTLEGKVIKFKNEIIVQCEININCEESFTSLGLNNFSKLSKGFYLINLDISKDIFEYSQKLHEKANVKIAHPNFIKERVYR